MALGSDGRPSRLAMLFRLLLLGGCLSAAWAAGLTPLVRAHAHNDYQHPRPLLDALEHGFRSVEADIHLVDGRLLVAHERSEVRPERTLERLYLDPLLERVRKNGGRIYPEGPELSLLVDIKTDAGLTYQALRPVLARYTEMLTCFRPGRTHRKAVTVILSGNRPRRLLEAEEERWAAIDGRLDDLGSKVPVELVPWISANWAHSFRWTGEGRMPEEERQKLRQIVGAAHREGRRLRFWGTPDRPAVWNELLATDVDLIGTDDLAGLRRFLLIAPARGRPGRSG